MIGGWPELLRRDPDAHGEPGFLAVVTGWGYAYRRRDGVLVLPIGTLTA